MLNLSNLYLCRMREQKILISRDGPDSNVLKFKPPMVFTIKDADRLVDTLDMVLGELDSQFQVTSIKLEVNIQQFTRTYE